MGIKSYLNQVFTGNSSVEHSDYLGGQNEAYGKASDGTKLQVSQRNDQTIVDIGANERLIMNGPGGGLAVENSRPGDRQNHSMNWDAANHVKAVVSAAMEDGTITRKEFDNIKLAAEQALESHAKPTTPVTQVTSHQGKGHQH